MNLRRLAATAVLTIAAVGIAAGTSHADAAPAEIGYEAKLVGDDVVTTLNGGFFAIEGDGKQVAVKDGGGNDVVVLPLAYNLDDRNYPLEQHISNDGKTLTLTPVTDVARSEVAPSLLREVASTEENQGAMEAFKSQLGIATAVGSLIGLAIGAVAGGIIGGIATAVTGPGLILGILAGIATGAAAGSIIGTVLVGGPTLLVAGIDLANTL
ncbi:MAG: ammonium transporter, partial [Aldersonia sp.]|nr:ammonium transporter [Aldersonia sp.]